MLKDLSNAEHEVAGLKNHNSGRACTVTVTAGGRVVMQHTNSDLISQDMQIGLGFYNNAFMLKEIHFNRMKCEA